MREMERLTTANVYVLVCIHTTIYGKPLSSANNVLSRVGGSYYSAYVCTVNSHLNNFLIRSTKSKALHEIYTNFNTMQSKTLRSISLICSWFN